jgi:hypothetical protein
MVSGASPSRIEASALQEMSVDLGPSERLIVPLGIVLLADSPLSPHDMTEEQKAKEASAQAFQNITSSKPGTIFRTEVHSVLRGVPAKDQTVAIRKLRESFRPPSYPAHSDFAFGPEWKLAGVALDGERTVFDSIMPNFFEITASNEIGSCPILYARGEPDGLWFRYGKVLHQARSRTAQQKIEFDGLVHQFRIVEEEFERSAIRDVKLDIELTDGRTLTLLPDRADLAFRRVIELYANDEMEINFVLPEGLKNTNVLHSQLTITGFYDRYPALLFSRTTEQ